MKIAIACDHAGWELKEAIKPLLGKLGHKVTDLGTDSAESVDYPDYILPAARAVATGEVERGISICGTGIGASIVANKVPGIRAALCYNVEMAKLSRTHNDANVLSLGGRMLIKDEAFDIVKVWLETEFSGGRHGIRVDKIKKIEDMR